MIKKRKIYIIFQDDHHYCQSCSTSSIKEAIKLANKIDKEHES